MSDYDSQWHHGTQLDIAMLSNHILSILDVVWEGAYTGLGPQIYYELRPALKPTSLFDPEAQWRGTPNGWSASARDSTGGLYEIWNDESDISESGNCVGNITLSPTLRPAAKWMDVTFVSSPIRDQERRFVLRIDLPIPDSRRFDNPPDHVRYRLSAFALDLPKGCDLAYTVGPERAEVVYQSTGQTSRL